MIKLAEGEKPTAPAAPAQDTRNAPSVTAPITSRAKDVFGDKNNLIAMLAAAGGSGVLGGYLSSKTPGLRGETPGQRRKRIILNALAAGGAGGVAMGGGLLGASMLKDPPGAQPQKPSLLSKAISPFVGWSATPATLGAAGGLYAGNRIGAKIDKAQALTTFSNRGRASQADLNAAFNTAVPSRHDQAVAMDTLGHRLVRDPNFKGKVTDDMLASEAKQVNQLLQRGGFRRSGYDNDLTEGIQRQLVGKRRNAGLIGGIAAAAAGALGGEAARQIGNSFNQ